MTYSPETIEKIKNCGMLGYSIRKMVNILNIADPDLFRIDFENPDSEIAKAYQSGVDLFDFTIDRKLFDLAKDGNLEALNKLEERKRKYQKENLL